MAPPSAALDAPTDRRAAAFKAEAGSAGEIAGGELACDDEHEAATTTSSTTKR
jgi:hypothetical protein